MSQHTRKLCRQVLATSQAHHCWLTSTISASSIRPLSLAHLKASIPPQGWIAGQIPSQVYLKTKYWQGEMASGSKTNIEHLSVLKRLVLCGCLLCNGFLCGTLMYHGLLYDTMVRGGISIFRVAPKLGRAYYIL